MSKLEYDSSSSEESSESESDSSEFEFGINDSSSSEDEIDFGESDSDSDDGSSEDEIDSDEDSSNDDPPNDKLSLQSNTSGVGSISSGTGVAKFNFSNIKHRSPVQPKTSHISNFANINIVESSHPNTFSTGPLSDTKSTSASAGAVGGIKIVITGDTTSLTNALDVFSVYKNPAEKGKTLNELLIKDDSESESTFNVRVKYSHKAFEIGKISASTAVAIGRLATNRLLLNSIYDDKIMSALDIIDIAINSLS